jgi:hypothetical protein
LKVPYDMSFKTTALQELENKRGSISSKSGLVGFDGFIDLIKQPVSQRYGPGEDFTPIPTIAEFGERISRAAGKSTNIELYPRMEKLGGNGPILSNALLSAGLKLRYIGTLGKPDIHPLFRTLAEKTEAISLAEPSITHALEFSDGKIMLGEMASLQEVTFDAMLAQVGEGKLLDIFSRADLLAMVNWTMIPYLSDVLTSILDRIMPVMPPRDQRIFFFDLADPEKRSEGDIKSVLQTIRRFQEWGSVTLGLNLKEALTIARVLGLSPEESTEEGLRRLASKIRQSLHIDTVVVHPRESAACATRDDSWWIPGPYTDTPFLTTGAGDHFNSGFCLGQLMHASPLACLAFGVAASGYYVRKGRSPSLNDIDQFLRQWN